MDIFKFQDALPHLEGKLVALRVDVNSPFTSGKFTASARLRAAADTIDQLCEADARVIVMSHNARDGEAAFVGNGQIAGLLRDMGNTDLIYPGNSFSREKDRLSDEAVGWVTAVEPGQAILLQNIRYLGGETAKLSPSDHANTPFVRQFMELGLNAYVNDAYSASHRGHRSITGFAEVPNIAGPVATREIEAVSRLETSFGDRSVRRVFVLGGMKLDDYFPLIYRAAREGIADNILPGGMLANLLLAAKEDRGLGEAGLAMLGKRGFLESQEGERSLLEQMKEVLTIAPELFVTPVDFAYLVDGQRREYTLAQLRRFGQFTRGNAQLDIGTKTAQQYAEIIRGSNAAFLKGPLGNVDHLDPKKGHIFSAGSRTALEAMQDPKVYAVVGGGDSTAMLGRLKLKGARSGYHLDHVSLAGGALLLALAGEKLAGVEALKASYQKYEGKLPFSRTT
ncbi:MAG: phosphoglycerate kinase [Nanoarchaeota archaeon]|nr:phosphoglycerate kinase [Nanoarchaeota archaeon]